MHKLQAAQQTVNAVLALTVRFILNNNLMKFGRTSYLRTECHYFFTHITKSKWPSSWFQW
jgi:hypothetical protein